MINCHILLKAIYIMIYQSLTCTNHVTHYINPLDWLDKDGPLAAVSSQIYLAGDTYFLYL